MPDPDPIILLTRPAKQAAEFRKLLGIGADVMESPIIKIRYLEKPLDLENYSGVIFTSRNAVDAVATAPFRHGLEAFAVGEKTALAAREIGLATTSANGNADMLVRTILRTKKRGPLLLIHGKYTTGRIEEQLNTAGIETNSVVVYEQLPMHLSPEAVSLLRGDRQVLLPLFSARSAAILSEATREAEAVAPIILAAISQVALDAWKGPDPVSAEVALTPTADAMAAVILRRISRTP